MNNVIDNSFCKRQDNADSNQRTQLNGHLIASIDSGSIVQLFNRASTTSYLAGVGIQNHAVNTTDISIIRIF